MILLNTLTLILNDYSFRETPGKTNWRIEMQDYTEYIFNGIFIFEFALKAFGMGFILEKGTYLRDPWNIIDFIVVITGLILILFILIVVYWDFCQVEQMLVLCEQFECCGHCGASTKWREWKYLSRPYWIHCRLLPMLSCSFYLSSFSLEYLDCSYS